MTTYSWGDVVLIRFPQTGTMQHKQRPALVILDIGDADLVVAPITSVFRSGSGDVALADWSTAGLLKPSWVRLAKVATLEKVELVRPLGKLGSQNRTTVTQVWNTIFVLG